MLKVILFDAHGFEKEMFEEKNQAFRHTVDYVPVRLTAKTAALAKGYDVVCAFANDKADSETLRTLKELGVRLLALRSAGFNHVDLKAAKQLGLPVVRVPKYSPYSVAEHATCLLLALNRKIHRAHARVREMNFSLDGLMGFDIHGKTVGIVGTGSIGSAFARIMKGFGANLLAYDLKPDKELAALGVVYVKLDELLASSDIISLHVPLNESTRHLIDDKAFGKMKPGVFLINTGRGALVDTRALIQNLKSRKIGAAGLDVYEEEENIFFQDLSAQGLEDDQLARLLTFPNVLITSHQGFLTRDALANIATTTLQNVSDFEAKKPLINEVRAD